MDCKTKERKPRGKKTKQQLFDENTKFFLDILKKDTMGIIDKSKLEESLNKKDASVSENK